MKKMMLVVALLMAAPLAVAQDCTVDTLVVQPNPAHTADQGFGTEVLVRGTCSAFNVPFAPVVTVEGATITIEFQRRVTEGPTIPVVTPWGDRVRLPRLAAGTYTIVVETWMNTLATQTLQVIDPSFRVTPSFGGERTEVVISQIAALPECQGVCPPLEVFFGNTKARNVRFAEPGVILAEAPAGSGTVAVRLQQGNAQVTVANAFRYGQPFESDMERVLFPVNLMARGGFGSDWATDLVVRNDGPVTIDTKPHFWAPSDSPVLPIPMPIIPGGKSNFYNRERDGGEFLYAPSGLEKNLSYSSHVIDRSRSELDLGTEIPVVREEDAAPVIKLLEVPVDARYRAKLRIYNLDENGSVYVTLRDPADGRAVQRMVQLTGYQVCPNAPCFSERAAFGVLDLDAIPELRTMLNGVDVTIEAPTKDARIWGFVTVTNNETQHVTAYTPQHRRRAQ